MRTTLFLSCLVLSSCCISAMAAPAPKVIFVGDQFTYVWQQSAAFKANHNWIGAGTSSECCLYGTSNSVAAAFPAVLNQHPDYVFLETGTSDLVGGNSSATKEGMKFEGAASAIISIVQMAKKANVKIIIGSTGLGLLGDNESFGFLGRWLQQFADSENVPIVNFTSLYVGCDSQGQCPLLDPNPSPADGGPFSITVPNAAGFQVITQMAQAAIATYILKITGGYLSDVETYSGAEGPNSLPTPPTNINLVAPGATLQFTPMATWTDGVTRPMTNVPYGGVLGTWWSTNPEIVAVDQHGVVNAYSPGTAQIWFRSSTGHTFSPWGLTVVQWSPLGDIGGPVY